ncbi:hypothetical protein ANN_18868 [Periplaneta americana]|uniref:Uncharacterized protein n=1 Tax=Periplaneta americana TaxID=6978 RepID=A0ABQ8SQF8_PERAM|nr:hypothetical protein ANN_18868 [Periplaneta americana]
MPLRTNIVINNEPIEQVNNFNYLGCNISYDKTSNVEIKLPKFQQLVGTIKRTLCNEVRKETVLKFYEVLAIPSLIYVSEIWTLTEKQKKRMEAAEMRLLRSLADYSLLHHKRNTEISEELNMTNVTTHKYINESSVSWEAGGKKTFGEAESRWEDNIKVDLREMGYDNRDWINLAQDRDRWLAYVRAAMNLRAVFSEVLCCLRARDCTHSYKYVSQGNVQQSTSEIRGRRRKRYTGNIKEKQRDGNEMKNYREVESPDLTPVAFVLFWRYTYVPPLLQDLEVLRYRIIAGIASINKGMDGWMDGLIDGCMNE